MHVTALFISKQQVILSVNHISK